MEVRQAIIDLMAHKRLGLDSFIDLSYKKIPDIVVPPLSSMINSLRDGASLTPNTLRPNIVIIPKLDQDVQSWANFHPISLLNVGLKLLTKFSHLD